MIFQQFNLFSLAHRARATSRYPLRGRRAGRKADRDGAGRGAAGLRRHRRQGAAATPTSCPAGRSSASASPGRWPPPRTSCWPTRPPARSTRETTGEVLRLLRRINRELGIDDRRHHPRDGGRPLDLRPRRGAWRTGGWSRTARCTTCSPTRSRPPPRAVRRTRVLQRPPVAGRPGAAARALPRPAGDGMGARRPQAPAPRSRRSSPRARSAARSSTAASASSPRSPSAASRSS